MFIIKKIYILGKFDVLTDYLPRLIYFLCFAGFRVKRSEYYVGSKYGGLVTLDHAVLNKQSHG